MNCRKQSSVQVMPRTQSFINRTLYSVLSINKKKGWYEVVEAITKGINTKICNNSNGSQNKNNVRCLRIQQCYIDTKYQQGQDKKIDKQDNLVVPEQIVNKLFINLAKLVITKCNINTLQLYSQSKQQRNKQKQLFPNLLELDCTKNNLQQFPKFIYQCKKLDKIDVSKNCIKIITNNLAMMNNLKIIKIFDNPISKISRMLIKEVINGNKILQIQWKLNLLFDSISAENQGGQSVPSVRTNFTEGNEFDVDSSNFEKNARYHQNTKTISLQLFPNLSLSNNPDHYIDTQEIVKYQLKRYIEQNHDIVSQQLQILIMRQHIGYLEYVEELIDQSMCRNCIAISFKNKKYASLDFMLKRFTIYEKYSKIDEIDDQQKNKNTKNINNSKRKTKQKNKKQDKQNYMIVSKNKIKIYPIERKIQQYHQPLIDTNGKIKIKQNDNIKNFQNIKSTFRAGKSICPQTVLEKLQNIDFKLPIPLHNQSCSYLDRHRKSENINILFNNNIIINNQKECYDKDIEKSRRKSKELTLEKLSTYNSWHIKSISVSALKQITLNQLIWLLNQLQFIEKSEKINKNHVIQVFKLNQVQVIINNVLQSEDALQNIINTVYYKNAFKIFIMYSEPQFLNDYGFTSLTIIKSILFMDDFELIKYIFEKYPNFSESIFGNTPFLESTISQNTNVSEKSQFKKLGDENYQWVNWKHIVNPSSKIYKYIYKWEKIFKKTYLSLNHTKNWHFPEYRNRQIFLNEKKGDENGIIKEYEQFQQNMTKKKQTANYRHLNLNNPLSIAKKIYLQVIDSAKNSVRSIGKSKSKSNRKKQYENRKQLFPENKKIFHKNLSLKNINLFKSIFLSPLHNNATQRQHHNQQSNQFLQYNHKCTRKNSISVVSKQKYKIKPEQQKQNIEKKKGISICSNSDTQSLKLKNNIKSPTNPYKNINKTVYLDLSKRCQTPTSSIDNIQDESKKKNMHEDEVFLFCSSFEFN